MVNLNILTTAEVWNDVAAKARTPRAQAIVSTGFDLQTRYPGHTVGQCLGSARKSIDHNQEFGRQRKHCVPTYASVDVNPLAMGRRVAQEAIANRRNEVELTRLREALASLQDESGALVKQVLTGDSIEVAGQKLGLSRASAYRTYDNAIASLRSVYNAMV